MEYFQWKRKIKVCATVLLLFCVVLLPCLFHEIVIYQKENYIPVKTKFHIREISEDQEVLTVSIWSVGFNMASICYMFIMNKEGKWKLVNEKEIYPLYDIYDNSFSYSAILQDETIPWQQTKITMNQKLLERAMNMPDLESRCRPVYADERAEGLVWHPTQGRRHMFYHGNPIKKDYAVLYIQKKLSQLESLGRQALGEE